MSGLRKGAERCHQAIDGPFFGACRDRLDGLRGFGHGGRDAVNAAPIGAGGRDVRGDGRDLCFAFLYFEVVCLCFGNGLL